MTRARLWAINVVCWTIGVLFVIGGGWVLDQFVRKGALREVLEWILIGLAVTLFGGVSMIAARRTRGPTVSANDGQVGKVS